ncbi:MAG: hypothetical protein JSS84_09500 [Bacteroidetes bacterium]|nr:hypothetical protein [Bacteroidota bacterium]
MNVLIDANIPSNVWLWESRPEPRESAKVMEAAGNGVIQGYMTPTLFLYSMLVLGSGVRNNALVKAHGEDLLKCVTIIPQGKRVFLDGFEAGLWNDIEDCWQYHAAKRFKDPIEAIVTTEAERFNKQGMVGIKAYTATDFVKKFLR